MSDPLSYFSGDEEPPWVESVVVNGTAPNLSTGWTFVARIVRENTVELEKDSGIVGDVGGSITVTWEQDDLALIPGNRVVLLTATRTADDHELTVIRKLHIRPRHDDAAVDGGYGGF